MRCLWTLNPWDASKRRGFKHCVYNCTTASYHLYFRGSWQYIHLFSIFTDRVRSTTVRYCFHRCLSVHRGRGYPKVPTPRSWLGRGGGGTPRYLPHQARSQLGGGGTPRYLPPSKVPTPTRSQWGGYPKVPTPQSKVPTHCQVLMGEVLPKGPYPPARSWWGGVPQGEGYPRVPTPRPGPKWWEGYPKVPIYCPRYLPPPHQVSMGGTPR